jgi:type IV pilus assembly protein PilB
MIVADAKPFEIKKVAVSEGMRTLRMVGIMKAREGITSLEEVFRTTAGDE